jgi:putative component of toxin-antitoxin plasmid stabilization module
MVRERPVSVQFFRLDSGREPVREWLKGMRREHRKAIGEDVKTLQFGWPIGMPVARKMDEGLWELRSNLGPGIARTFFTIYEQHRSVAWIHKEVSKDSGERTGAC